MAKKMQEVSFRNVEEFLDYLPGRERKVTELLRNTILECLPNCTEKLNYNVPFYRIRKNICFIWPASITWGGKNAYNGVRIGFTRGHQLNDELGYLERGQRKQVYWKNLISIGEQDLDLIRMFLFEAAKIDARQP